MVHVDDAVGKTGDEIGRKDLHVARQNDEVDVVLFEQIDLAALGGGFAVRADFDLVKRDAVEFGKRARAGMIAENQRNFAGSVRGPDVDRARRKHRATRPLRSGQWISNIAVSCMRKVASRILLYLVTAELTRSYRVKIYV
jgi:hypothetical protein